ncbi:hypothetical protein TNCV_4369031 [Trichonephila clavipes]|nr:hypothetical protein TNCV_4369031 [Trichonephila clavipes]
MTTDKVSSDNYKVVIYPDRTRERRFNTPITNEIAAVVVSSEQIARLGPMYSIIDFNASLLRGVGWDTSYEYWVANIESEFARHCASIVEKSDEERAYVSESATSKKKLTHTSSFGEATASNNSGTRLLEGPLEDSSFLPDSL